MGGARLSGDVNVYLVEGACDSLHNEEADGAHLGLMEYART